MALIATEDLFRMLFSEVMRLGKARPRKKTVALKYKNPRSALSLTAGFVEKVDETDSYSLSAGPP